MNNQEGCYIYGVIGTDHKQDFGPIGIGGRDDVVYTLPDQNIAAVISRSPIVKYPVSRANMTAHAKVLDRVAEEDTVLPVRFSTIAENEQVVGEKLLRARHQELVDLLKEMEGKLELRVKARWIDMDAIFAEVVEEHKDIKALKEASRREKNEQKKHANMVKVGEKVQKALEEKRKREAQELLDALSPLSLTRKELQIYGDENIVYAAFLVSREKEPPFAQKLNEIDQSQGKRKQLTYLTSPVAYNFVELVVHL